MLHSDMTEVPPTTFQRSQAEVNNDITLDMACHNNRIRSVSAPAMHDSKFASTFWKGTQHGKQDFPCYFEIRELNIDKHNHKSLFLVSPEHLWKIQDKIGSFCNLHVYDTTTLTLWWCDIYWGRVMQQKVIYLLIFHLLIDFQHVMIKHHKH